PSQPPSTSIPLNTTVANRLIHEPAPTSKSILLVISQNNIEKEMGHVSKFIPQELAENVAIRQRRECAWYARILNCTNFIRNNDSMLAKFKDGISNFKPVAMATPITIPKLMAIHGPSQVTQPRENPIAQSSWATVTRNGQKKARVTKYNTVKSTRVKKANHVPKAPNNLPRRQAPEGNSTPPSDSDKRILLRLPQEHE
ncbi:hypothetical protein EPUL_003090, partial [Erysiphe pulchra]